MDLVSKVMSDFFLTSCKGSGMAEKSYPSPGSGAAAGRSYPTSEVRGRG